MHDIHNSFECLNQAGRGIKQDALDVVDPPGQALSVVKGLSSPKSRLQDEIHHVAQLTSCSSLKRVKGFLLSQASLTESSGPHSRPSEEVATTPGSVPQPVRYEVQLDAIPAGESAGDITTLCVLNKTRAGAAIPVRISKDPAPSRPIVLQECTLSRGTTESDENADISPWISSDCSHFTSLSPFQQQHSAPGGGGNSLRPYSQQRPIRTNLS